MPVYEVELRDAGVTYPYIVEADNVAEAEERALDAYTSMRLKKRIGYPYNPFALSVIEKEKDDGVS